MLSPLLLIGCGASEESKSLLVSAASDLQELSVVLGEQFQKEINVPVAFNIGSSGMLAQQIEAGARPDVFASADTGFVERLQKGGFIEPGTVRTYAKGRLVVLAARGSPRIGSLDDLKRPEFAKIAIANPETAPYGAAAREAIEASGLSNVLQPRLVIAENVRQAFHYVDVGEVDAAFVSVSLVAERRHDAFAVPESLHHPLLQAAAVLKRSKKPKEAKQFVEFLAGEKGSAILTRHGFERPDAKP